MFNFIKIILSLFCNPNKIQSKSKKSKRDKFNERCEKLRLSVALDIDIDNFEKSSENKFDNNKKDKIWKVECDNWYSIVINQEYSTNTGLDLKQYLVF